MGNGILFGSLKINKETSNPIQGMAFLEEPSK
jgi:hypothetical protein